MTAASSELRQRSCTKLLSIFKRDSGNPFRRLKDAGAEIVKGDANPECAQLPQGANHVVFPAQDGVLGDFQKD